MTVRSTVSHVPQLWPHAFPQLDPQALAPHGLQLEAQGAEQQELTLPPKQPPACADADISATAASVRT